MNLLTLQSGGLSLEFSLEEWPAIQTALAALGSVDFEQAPTFDYVNLGDARFMLMNDWDDPCLISVNNAAEPILRWLADAPSLALDKAA